MKPRVHAGLWSVAAVMLMTSVAMPSQAQSPAAASLTPASEPQFVYRFRPRDTLIQVCRRLLLEPRRWPEVQRLNGIRDPFNIPPDTPVRIPYAWLRLTTDTAIVQAVSGTVLRDGVPVAQGDVLTQGTRVETAADASVSIRFADQSVVTLQESSVLRLEQLRNVSGADEGHGAGLRLESGRAETTVKPKRDVGRFEIVTPVAISAVRGTRFRTSFDASSNHSTAETLEGSVGVTAARDTVAVAAGFGTRVEASGDVLPPVPLLPAPDLASLPTRITQPSLSVKFPPLAGAAAYRLQLAADAEFRTLLLDDRSATPEFDIAIREDGEFWLRARAIDSLGIEGQDAVHGLTQHVLPPSPALLSPEDGAPFTSGSVALQWAPVAGVDAYRLQVARDVQFSELVREQAVDGGARSSLESLAPGTYYWRSSALNARGEAGPWSPVRSFTQRAPAPVIRAERVDRSELRVAWDARAGERYRVQSSRFADFRRLVADVTVDTGGYVIEKPRVGLWYLRVQVLERGVTPADFGAPGRFDVPLPGWVKALVSASVLLPALL